jgi:xanthine dehydrogenase accessory factor
LFGKLIEDARENKHFVLVTVVEADGSTPARVGFRMAVYADGSQHGTVGGGNLEHTAHRLSIELLRAGGPAFLRSFSMEKDLNMACGGEVRLFFEPYSPWRLTIAGGGHVAQAVAPLALSAGFLVEILDDRPEIAEAPWPVGVRVRIGALADLCAELTPGPRHCALVMTYQHVRDAEAAAGLLSHDLTYLGVIGSRTKAEGLRRALLALGTSAERVERLRTPVGFPIGAQTPVEIAVSIVAELIAVRAGRPLQSWV